MAWYCIERKFLHVSIEQREQDKEDDTMKYQTETCGSAILLRWEPSGVGEPVGGRRRQNDKEGNGKEI
jgi:hypothetical protein